MTAFNIVRFRVKPGRDQEFMDAHNAVNRGFDGMRKFSLVNTGPGTYCAVGEWDSFDNIIAARPGMIGVLESFRHLLEDLGGGTGVTDPVSGSTIIEIGAPAKPKAKRPKAKKKPAKRAKPTTKKKVTKKLVNEAAKKKVAKRRKR